MTRDRIAAEKIQAEQSILSMIGAAGAASSGKTIADVIGQTAKAGASQTTAAPSISKAFKFFEDGSAALAA